MWNGLGVDPTQWESLKSEIRLHSRVRIGTVEHTHAVLPGIVGHGEPLAVRAETALVARGYHRVQLDLPDAVADLPYGNIIRLRSGR